MQRLPTGRQVFENIRKEKLLYVDKTHLIHKMITQSQTLFFLSRPRRFGKTLLCYTFCSLFEGKKELFKLKGTAADALKQIDSREYLTPWKGNGKVLHKIGVSFDYKKRKIREWKIRGCK
jgi:hypothetical protein